MRPTAARSLRLLCVPVVAATLALASASSASAANPTFPFDWKVDASTHLKKLNQTVTVPTGSFVGSVDLVTGALTGHITLPPATSTVKLAGIGLARATFQIAEVRPVTGHIDFATLRATATSVFNIKVVRVSPALAAVRQSRRQLVHDVHTGDGHDVRAREPHRRVDVLGHLHDPEARRLRARRDHRAQPRGARTGEHVHRGRGTPLSPARLRPARPAAVRPGTTRRRCEARGSRRRPCGTGWRREWDSNPR